MKKTKLFLFTIITFCLFLVNIKAANFTCKIGNYTVEYNSSGEIVGAKYTSDGTSLDKHFESAFSPKNASECPESEAAQIKFIDGNRTFYVAKVEGFVSEKGLNMGGCSGYTYKTSCEHNKFYSCIWNENVFGTSYCNTDKLIYVQCGDAFDIPYQAPQIISFAVNLLKIATPIILIIISIIALLKAISASNEDEIKKAQKGLVKKVIAAVMVFFIISIVQFVVMKVADTNNSAGASEADNLSNCLSCFLNNDCGNNAYYKTNVFGKYECTYFNDINNPIECKGNK